MLACGLVFLVHLTSAMIVGPAGLLAYLVATLRARWSGTPLPLSRHLGLAAMVPLILLLNAFWLWPGYWLASTAGTSDFVFAHPESVLRRIGDIAWTEAPVESIALALALIGLASLARRAPEAAAGLGGVVIVGFGWGYLAGAFRSLDSLQPGRHTYACFSAACVAGGIGLGEVLDPAPLGEARQARPSGLARAGPGGRADLRAEPGRLGPGEGGRTRSRSFRAGRPLACFKWSGRSGRTSSRASGCCSRRPGSRSTAWATRSAADTSARSYRTSRGSRSSAGPYLHTPVVTNFTQFGENKLFEKKDWDRDFFVRHARLYRPAAICCWSPKARAFCRANPDLIRVKEDDGTILLGRVVGFEGAAIRGSATVEASPDRLVVRRTRRPRAMATGWSSSAITPSPTSWPTRPA